MPHIAGFRGQIEGSDRDATRAIYRYHQRFAGPGRTFERRNVIAAVALSPFSDGQIRPHEATTPARRDAELARIRETRTHAAPFLAGFRDPSNELERLFKKIDGARPTLETTTPDGVVHRLWRVQDAELLGKLRHHFTPRKLHLLDGHDRYEAMLAYREQLGGDKLAQYSSANYGLACLVSLDDPTLATAARHRIVRGELEVDAVLAAARKHFIIDKLAGCARDLGKQQAALADTVAHQPALIVVFSGTADAYKLTLSPDVSPFLEGATSERALQKLEPVVADLFAKSMPGVETTTTIHITEAIAQLDAGAAAYVMLRPLSVEQIAHVDEQNLLLPAGSTAFHPPVAPLVTMAIDPDEDLV